MKKLLSVSIIIAMMLASVSLAEAKGNASKSSKSRIEVKQDVQKLEREQEEVEEVDAEEVEVDEVVEEVEEVEEVDEDETIEEDGEDESEEKAEDKKAKVEELKNKIEELRQQNKDIKTQAQELKKQFKKLRNNKEERKTILAEIAKIKREVKDDSIGVFVRGNDVKFDVPPVIKGGRTLIPVRAVVEALGAQVAWDEESRTVTIIKDITKTVAEDTYESVQMEIKLQIDSAIAIVDGKEIALDTAAEVNDNRTIVPLRFIAETFGLDVDWDGESGTVIVEDETDSDIETDGEIAEKDVDNENNEDVVDENNNSGEGTNNASDNEETDVEEQVSMDETDSADTNIENN